MNPFVKTAISLVALISAFCYALYNSGGITFSALNPYYIAMSFMGFVVQHFFITARWCLFVNNTKPVLDYMSSLKIICFSNIANSLFLSLVGGLATRTLMTARKGLNMITSFSCSVLDRMATLFALVFFAGMALPLMYVLSFTPPLGLMISLLVAGSLMTVLAIFVAVNSKALARFIKRRKIRHSLIYVSKILARPVVSGQIILSSLIAQFAFFMAAYFILQANGEALSLLEFLVVVPFVSLIAALPISIGGWGVREGAFVFGLGLLGVSAEAAFMISVEVGVMSLLSSCLIGLCVVCVQKYQYLNTLKGAENHARSI